MHLLQPSLEQGAAATADALPACQVSNAHFIAAMHKVGPSIARGAGVEIPPVK
jgi:hypothetical protein